MAVQNTPGEGDVNVVQFRIERGAEAMATDGRIGIVEQIVVDRTNGQLLSLVMRGEETNTEFEMPASHVLRATGDHVYLDVSRADLMNHPEMTTPYDPEQYVPVYQGDAMPPEVASQTAAQQDTPVITDVEENAAELVAPETTATPPPQPTRRTDERVIAATSQPAATGPVTGETTWTPRGDALAEADTTPTVKLGRAGVAGQTPTDWDEAVGSEERPVPTPEPSATPETTGPLMGGKPSTGGMGTASSVPHSTAPALDTVPTSTNLPPYTTEHATATQPPTPNLVTADEPETMKDASLNPAAATDPQLGSLAAPSPMRALPPISSEALPTPSPQLMTTPSRQLANIRDHLPDLLLNMAKSPEVWILAGSLGAGIIGGILFRRDVSLGTSPSPTARQAKRAAGNALDRAQDRLRDAQNRIADKTGDVARAAKNAQSRIVDTSGDAAKNTTRDSLTDKVSDAAKSTSRSAKRNASGTKKAAKRVARRGRWFRRGLLLGGTGAMLFAPRPGEQTRARLMSTWEQLRSRIA